jgi:predicted glycosyltransferase
MPKALIWGESLVGSGHARVQSELARRLQKNGWDVACVTGSKQHTDNFDFGDARMVYQPPLHLKSAESDPYNMTNLITPAGETLFTDQAYRHGRRERLLAFYHGWKPDAVITEMWPFARANFDFEVIPLAEAVRRDGCEGMGCPPRLYSIARDIMFPPRLSSPDSPGLLDDRYALAAAFFAPRSIMVRGDRNVIPLEFSIGPMPDDVRDKIDYVGYFVDPAATRGDARDQGRREVLVSSGGGVTRDSLILFKKSIEARKFSGLRDRVWRIIVPHGCPEDGFAEIVAAARAEAPDGGIVVERNRRDFLALLADAALVICHAGNTVVEALSSGVPVLVAPRGMSKNNLEQQVRAKAFFDKGLIEVASLDEIETPQVLAGHADRAVKASRTACPIMVDGAARMARRITADLVARTPARRNFTAESARSRA